MTLYALADITPTVDADAWVAPDANVIGNVVLEAGSSVWFGSTLRGDNEVIHVGKGSNVQENCVFHTDPGCPLTIGRDCTIGHKVIGMGATVLNGAKIGENCLIGAGALITENKVIPDGSLVMGVPGKVVRALDDAAIAGLTASARHYSANAARFRDGLKEV